MKVRRWEPGNNFCPVCGEDKFKDLDADIWSDWCPPYCPNCGARMDGGDEDILLQTEEAIQKESNKNESMDR